MKKLLTLTLLFGAAMMLQSKPAEAGYRWETQRVRRCVMVGRFAKRCFWRNHRVRVYHAPRYHMRHRGVVTYRSGRHYHNGRRYNNNVRRYNNNVRRYNTRGHRNVRSYRTTRVTRSVSRSSRGRTYNRSSRSSRTSRSTRTYRRR